MPKELKSYESRLDEVCAQVEAKLQSQCGQLMYLADPPPDEPAPRFKPMTHRNGKWSERPTMKLKCEFCGGKVGDKNWSTHYEACEKRARRKHRKNLEEWQRQREEEEKSQLFEGDVLQGFGEFEFEFHASFDPLCPS